MSNKGPVSSTGIERCIRFVNGHYYVSFLEKQEVGQKSIRYLSFDTLEEARAFRDECDKERKKYCLEHIKAENINNVYPYNLLKDLEIVEDETGIEYAWIVKNWENLYSRLENLLTQREKDCLKYYYQDYESLEQVAKHFGVTRERIRQILAKTLRKIKCHRTLLTLKVEVFEKYRKEKLEKIDKELEAYKKQRLEAIEYMEIEEMRKRVKQYDRAPKGSNKIDVLDLSVRAYNCLRKNHIDTIGDLCKMTQDDLLIIRNLGKKSALEVLEKLYKYNGVKLEGSWYWYDD